MSERNMKTILLHGLGQTSSSWNATINTMGKSEDILFHGDSLHCAFDDILVDMLLSKRLCIYGHSHPGEDTPIPSPQDRNTLKKIEQSSSKLISGRTGIEITFTSDMFNDFL